MFFSENFNILFGFMFNSFFDSILVLKGNYKGLSYIYIIKIIFLKFDKFYV